MFGKLFDQKKEDGQQANTGQQSPFDKPQQTQQAQDPFQQQQYQQQAPVQQSPVAQQQPVDNSAYTPQTNAPAQVPVSQPDQANNPVQDPNAPAPQVAQPQAPQEPQQRADMAALTHLDPRTAQALTRAQEEAKRIHQQYIEPDQILLGLLYDEQIYKEMESFSANSGAMSKEIQAKEVMGTYRGQPILSKISENIFDQAYRDSKMRGENFITPEDVLVVVFDPQYSTGKFLEAHGLKKDAVVEKFSTDPNVNFGKKSILEKYGVDLTQEAKAGKLDPVAGRDKEVDRIIHILLRRTKNNPIIIGETGVGKTAIVEGLAQQIVSGQVPKDLQGKRIFQLDVASLVAGASHRGEFEERLRGVISEVLGSSNKIILFIDEIHALMGTGEGEGMNAANIIKPHLARGHFQLIGATTTTEYRKNFEKDKAFERRFQPVIADEPSEENAFEMLKVLESKYEKFHHVTIPDEALRQCVKLAKKYIGERYLPDKAVDLLDEACAEVKLQMDSGQRTENQIRKADIEKVVSAWTGIPITRLTEDESEKLLKLEDRIHKRLVDQEEAVVAVAEAVRRGRIGLASGVRPIASFVFLGPTGVGKTELAKTLAELLFGRDDAMARLDMSEYMEKHEVAKLIGAPPGYVGYEEGGVLTEAVRKKPYSIVLMDEIEKAHPDVFNILLQLLEDGRLTDNKGNTISFKNTIIICTSNIGSSLIQQQLAMQDATVKKTPEEYEKIYKDLNKVVKDELIKFFRPELLNRFDEVVIFKPLLPEYMAGIARLGIAKTASLLKEQGFNLQISELAIAQLAKDGYDPIYGARPLRRLVQTAIENPIALAIISKKFSPGDTIVIDFNQNVNEFEFLKGGVSQAPSTLDDNSYRQILFYIAHPEKVVNEADRQMYIQLHDNVVNAGNHGNSLAVAILAVTDQSPVIEIQKLRNDLQKASTAGDELARSVLDMIAGQVLQLQSADSAKRAFIELNSPSTILSVEKRERFTALHNRLQDAKSNPLAQRIIVINTDTPSSAVAQIIKELQNASRDGDEAATDVLAAINLEIAEQAEKAHSQDPIAKFRKALQQVTNPLYLAAPENKEKFEKVYENIVKAYQTKNPLAIAILGITEISADQDLERLLQNLQDARKQGDGLATEVIQATDEAVSHEASDSLRNTLLLIVNPLTAPTAPEREKFTQLKEKVLQAGQKGNTLAQAILSMPTNVTMDALQNIADQLRLEKEKNDEIALLILDSLTSTLPVRPIQQDQATPAPMATTTMQAEAATSVGQQQVQQAPVVSAQQPQFIVTEVPEITQSITPPIAPQAGFEVTPQMPAVGPAQRVQPPQEVIPTPGVSIDPMMGNGQNAATNTSFMPPPITMPGGIGVASDGSSMQPSKE